MCWWLLHLCVCYGKSAGDSTDTPRPHHMKGFSLVVAGAMTRWRPRLRCDPTRVSARKSLEGGPRYSMVLIYRALLDGFWPAQLALLDSVLNIWSIVLDGPPLIPTIADGRLLACPTRPSGQCAAYPVKPFGWRTVHLITPESHREIPYAS